MPAGPMPEMAGNELRCLKKMSLNLSMSGREISSEKLLTSKWGAGGAALPTSCWQDYRVSSLSL